MTCWTLNREYCLHSYYSLTLINVMAVIFLYYVTQGKHRNITFFSSSGLLNVKTVGERCIRSVCCTTMSFGHQGKSRNGCMTIQPFKHIKPTFNFIEFLTCRVPNPYFFLLELCNCLRYLKLTLNSSLMFGLLALSVTTV